MLFNDLIYHTNLLLATPILIPVFVAMSIVELVSYFGW